MTPMEAVDVGPSPVGDPRKGESRPQSPRGLDELRRAGAWVADFWRRVRDCPRPVLLWIVVAVNGLLSVHCAVGTLQRWPNAGDEYSYVLQAELFSRLKLSVPSPEPRRSFDYNHVVNNGRFYSKYPPGWPLLLVPGVILGATWWINPLIGALTLVVFDRTARRHCSDAAANLGLLILLFNPFFILNSGSHFSHSSCLLMIALCTFFFFNWLDRPDSTVDAMGMGLFAGMAFLIRPLPMVGLLLPFGAYAVLHLRRLRWPAPGVRAIAAGALPALACLAGFLIYDYLQTGNPLLQPFTVYDPSDKPRIPGSIAEYWRDVRKYDVPRLTELNFEWLPLSMYLGLVFVARPALRRRGKGFLLVLSFLSLVALLTSYPADGGIRYGPRYLYEALVAVTLVMSLVLESFPRASGFVLVGILAANVANLVVESKTLAVDIQNKVELYLEAERNKLSDAVVILKTGSGSGHPGDLTRNGIHFNGPVLYVRDLGVRNRDIVAEFPDRSFYTYEYLPEEGVGRIAPFAPEAPSGSED